MHGTAKSGIVGSFGAAQAAIGKGRVDSRVARHFADVGGAVWNRMGGHLKDAVAALGVARPRDWSATDGGDAERKKMPCESIPGFAGCGAVLNFGCSAGIFRGSPVGLRTARVISWK